MNNENIWKNNRKTTKIIVSFILVLALFCTHSFVFAKGGGSGRLGDSGDELGTSSTTVLGESSTYSVTTIEELKDAFSKNINGDYRHLTIVLEADLHFSQGISWTPVGTEASPFNGIFDGNNHKITGVGTQDCPTLFGYVKDATIKNLLVVTARPFFHPNPYYGLLQVAQTSTITNCQVRYEPQESTMRMASLRSAPIVPDSAWMQGNGISSNPVVSTPEQLAGLALVVEGGHSYDGITITFSKDINYRGEVFQGIGSATKPLNGNIDGGGHKIYNITMDSSNPFGTGLINYADGSGAAQKHITIENLTIDQATISGGHRTGALLGYGKHVRVSEVYVGATTTVSGFNYVGGVAGEIELEYEDTGMGVVQSDVLEPYFSQVYSMADVKGNECVGGILGSCVSGTSHWGNLSFDEQVIDTAFTSGTISANHVAGGIVGFFGETSENTQMGAHDYYVSNAASIATIDVNKTGGGILGETIQDGSWDPPAVRQSYFAGKLQGVNHLGGLVGENGGMKDSYVSGHVVSNILLTENTLSKIYPTFGYMQTSPFGPLPEAENVYLTPNTVHKPGDRYNQSVGPADYAAYMVTSSWDNYELDPSSDIHTMLFDGSTATDVGAYFTTGTTPGISGFGSGNLTTASNTEVKGKFPTLDAFDTANDSMFQQFSTVSTSTEYTHFPEKLYVNPTSLEAVMDSPTGAAFTLPAGNWSFNGANSVEFDDLTLASGKNKATIQGGNIVFAAVPQAEITLPLTVNVDGIKLSYEVLFEDKALRPVDGEVPEAFLDHSISLSTLDTLHSIYYPEDLQYTSGSGPITVDLIEYADKELTNQTGTVANGVTLTILRDNHTLKIELSGLAFGKYYEMDFASGSQTIQDSAGNILDFVYSFGIIGNQKPTLHFDDTYPLYFYNKYDNNSTNAAKDEQFVSLDESDYDYNGYLEGVVVDNPEGVIDLGDHKNDGSYKLNVVSGHTLSGTHDYPTLTLDSSGNVDPNGNFYQIPGEYKITYQIPDKEDSSLSSNLISRTYRVYSKPFFTQGNKNYSLLTAHFDSTEMISISEDMKKHNLTVTEAMEKALNKRYLSDKSSPDYLAAYHFDYKGNKKDLQVSFDTSTLTDDVFKDGFQQALTIKAGTLEKTFILAIDSTTPDYEIIVENSTYKAINEFSRVDASKHFGAYVVRKSTGERVNKSIFYDYKNIDHAAFNRPQEVTLTVRGTEDSVINGIDMSVSTTVTVIIEKQNIYTHPDDKEDAVRVFWEATTDKVRSTAPEKELSFALSYEEAEHTPADIFIIAENRDGKVVDFTLPSGIKISLDAAKINKAKIPYNVVKYNLAIEPMYNLYIQRDAKDDKTQQFFTHDKIALPGKVTVTIPLNEDMPEENLKLYRIDAKTEKYVLEKTISAKDIEDRNLILTLTELEGRYILTTADLAGKQVGGQ